MGTGEKSADGHTQKLPVAGVGADCVDDREGELAFSEVLAEALILHVLRTDRTKERAYSDSSEPQIMPTICITKRLQPTNLLNTQSFSKHTTS
jgi:hypothetical protein